MNDDQRRDAAEKLMQAIKNNTSGAYDTWTKTDLKDPADRAAFVKNTVGLSTTPTPDDMQAMQSHIASNLQSDIEEIQKTKRPGEHAVGFACLGEDL
ncbi:MAG: hypothetical protein M3M96_01980 [Candidatus Eremiobacteraeota bacterium]|nr:hypothetical protein [Candidatus Eremiobacteraeota bacterium]